MSVVMAELEDETCISNELTALSARSSNASRGKSYGRKNRNTRNREYGFYPNGQRRNSETYSHYYENIFNYFYEKKVATTYVT